MKKRLKIFLLLAATLILGMIIGFLVSGRLVNSRIVKMQNYYSQTGFGREVMSIIKPTSEQREVLMPLLKNYADQNRDILSDFRVTQNENYVKLQEELKEVLDQDQINRLNNHWESRKHRRFQNSKPHPSNKDRGRKRKN